MNNSQNKKTIRENILNAINTGKVKMRPRWHFVAGAALFVLGVVLISLTIIFIISFIIFSLHATGVWFAPAFGFAGLNILLGSLPWVLIAVAILFIVILEILVRQYSFAYRRPLFYSALGVIGLVFVGGAIVSATPLHNNFYQNARQNKLPFAGGMYRGFVMHHPDTVHPGIITDIIEDGFMMEEVEDGIVKVIITPETRFPFGTDFAVDEKVLVLGTKNGTTISAFGIRKINNIPQPSSGRTSAHLRILMK